MFPFPFLRHTARISRHVTAPIERGSHPKCFPPLIRKIGLVVADIAQGPGDQARPSRHLHGNEPYTRLRLHPDALQIRTRPSRNFCSVGCIREIPVEARFPAKRLKPPMLSVSFSWRGFLSIKAASHIIILLYFGFSSLTLRCLSITTGKAAHFTEIKLQQAYNRESLARQCVFVIGDAFFEFGFPPQSHLLTGMKTVLETFRDASESFLF